MIKLIILNSDTRILELYIAVFSLLSGVGAIQTKTNQSSRLFIIFLSITVILSIIQLISLELNNIKLRHYTNFIFIVLYIMTLLNFLELGKFAGVYTSFLNVIVSCLLTYKTLLIYPK